MSIVKVDQKYLLELETEEDNIASASTLEIHYKDANGNTGQITASVKDGDDSVATADVTSVINSTNGPWKFEVFATISGANYYGTTFEQEITRHFE